MRVFITGISSGLGAGIARAALEAGAEVWGCSRRSPCPSVGGMGASVNFHSLDLNDAEGGPLVLREWVAPVEQWDLVVLNAGVLPPIADIAETSLDTLRGTMEVNVWANKWVLDTLFADTVRIDQVVAISSGASVSGHRGWNAYGISKAALNMLVKLYAVERPQTHFAALAPGLVDTAMQTYLTGLPTDDRFATVERLKEARGTEAMPSGATAGLRCWEAFPQLRELASGTYVDLRKMD